MSNIYLTPLFLPAHMAALAAMRVLARSLIISLFRRITSLFCEKNSLISFEQGIRRNALTWLEKSSRPQAQTSQNACKTQICREKFPVLREFTPASRAAARFIRNGRTIPPDPFDRERNGALPSRSASRTNREQISCRRQAAAHRRASSG